MAYTRLLRLYYRTEKPIPADPAQACRLVRATSTNEKKAVVDILDEFFLLGPDGWVQRRCEEELEKFKTQAEHSRKAGKLGGRPPKKITQWVSENNPVGFGKEPGGLKKISQPLTITNNQEPLSITQERVMEKDLEATVPAAAQKRGTRLPTDWALPDDWRAWASSTRPDVDVSLEAAKFCDYWHAKSGRDATKADWLATWRNWIRNAKGATRPALSVVSERAVL